MKFTRSLRAFKLDRQKEGCLYRVFCSVSSQGKSFLLQRFPEQLQPGERKLSRCCWRLIGKMNLAGSWESTLSEMLKRLWVLFFFLFSLCSSWSGVYICGRKRLWLGHRRLWFYLLIDLFLLDPLGSSERVIIKSCNCQTVFFFFFNSFSVALQWCGFASMGWFPIPQTTTSIFFQPEKKI